MAAEHLLQCQREAPGVTRAPCAGSDPSQSHCSPSPRERRSFPSGANLNPPPNFGVPPQAGAEMRGTHRLLRQSPQDLGEVGVHLLRRPLEELPAASHEQRVTCRERGLGTEGTLGPLPRTGCQAGAPRCWIHPTSAEIGGDRQQSGSTPCVPGTHGVRAGRLGYLRREPERPGSRPPT